MSKKVSYKGFNIESTPRLLQAGGYSVNGWVWGSSASQPIDIISLLPEKSKTCTTEEQADEIFIQIAIKYIDELKE